MGSKDLIIAMVMLLLAMLLVGGSRRLDVVSSLTKNVSGYLINDNGRYYVQPVTNDYRQVNGRSSTNELYGNNEENWLDPDERKNENVSPQSKVDYGTNVYIRTNSDDNDDDDHDNDDDNDDDKNDEKELAWPTRSKPWWLLVKQDTRSRGSFAIFGMLESAVGVVGKFIRGMIFEDTEEEDEVDSISSRNSAVSYRGHQLLRLAVKSNKQLRRLQQLMDNESDDVKFWTSLTAKDKTVDVSVAPAFLSNFKEFLREKNINYVMLMADLEKAIQTQNPRMPKERRQDLYSSQGHTMTWKQYHRYKDIMGYLDYLAVKYPQIVEVVTIGKSFEGRPLKIIKVSTGANENGEPKPAIWIDAGIHAREWISVAVSTYILNQLVEKNENYTRLLDITDWVIMPIANPDGYEFTHTDDRLWRKTRSVHVEPEDTMRQAPGFLHIVSQYTKWLFGGSCEGVDPNRNFHIHWGDGNAGASKDPCSDTYQGPSPFSEPETRAISNYILKNKKFIKSYLTMHSYSQMILCCGLTRKRPTDFDDLMDIANKAKKAIAKVNGVEYKVGSAAELLYPTTGSSDDWAKVVAGVKNSFTIELRDRGNYGFLLPASQIIPTARETWAGVRVIARMSAQSNNSN